MIGHLGALEQPRLGAALPSIDQEFIEELVEGAIEVLNSKSAAGGHMLSFPRFSEKCNAGYRLRSRLARISLFRLPPTTLASYCSDRANLFKNRRRNRLLRGFKS